MSPENIAKWAVLTAVVYAIVLRVPQIQQVILPYGPVHKSA